MSEYWWRPCWTGYRHRNWTGRLEFNPWTWLFCLSNDITSPGRDMYPTVVSSTVWIIGPTIIFKLGMTVGLGKRTLRIQTSRKPGKGKVLPGYSCSRNSTWLTSSWSKPADRTRKKEMLHSREIYSWNGGRHKSKLKIFKFSVSGSFFYCHINFHGLLNAIANLVKDSSASILILAGWVSHLIFFLRVLVQKWTAGVRNRILRGCSQALVPLYQREFLFTLIQTITIYNKF